MEQDESSRVDVDAEIEQAWAEFEASLSTRIAALEDGRSILVQTLGEEPDGAALPYVQLMSFAEGTARRCEVSSDDLLAPATRTGTRGAALYEELGFQAPSPDPEDDAPNWFLHADAEDHEALAHVVVQVLREAFEVLHPLLLAGMPAAPSGAEAPDSALARWAPEPVDLEVAHPVACEDELADLVQRTLQMVTGEPVERDQDGDWPYPLERGTAWVRLLKGEPTIRVFAVVVHGIRSRRAATREVAILNRDAVSLRYISDGNVLVIELDVNAGPFVPGHLVDGLARFSQAAAQQPMDFAARTGGRVW
ncbi:T3SS (YopN, CesT) and YbjN peptide-binding chaperone 1 [Phycicoccus duodecadis]|uniref:Uncharacterized protein n=1 Tax=Phycicoccus duodecadis TaxID=173053 RepID=A0A2N3YFU6_9MICO|nr:hypothetical protein [Phycicoccus duodecadis]PKW25723.1 hypothetical protein ATL31_0522 [Phycicoccus duodecadis]